MASISILAICYNHAAFLDEALHSLADLPAGVEVLIADDASSDGSVEILQNWQHKMPGWKFVFHHENQGNCKSFNDLLSVASGDWVLDFATDDVLISDQLLPWLHFAASHPEAGFCYADAWVFSGDVANGQNFSAFRKVGEWPEGQILDKLFGPSFICPPAVLFSRNALLHIGGYDENLSYEDFDAWLRLAREFPVVRYPLPVIHYRRHPASMSARLFKGKNRRHLKSTLEILKKVQSWPEFQEPPAALMNFIRYHLRLCFFLQFKEEATGFAQNLKWMGKAVLLDELLLFLTGKIPGLPHLFRFFRRP